MAVDAQGNAYVTGQTIVTDFPTADPVQPIGGGGDAYVTKLSASGSSLVYSTYFGGSNYDRSYAIALDPAGNAYITGATWGSFPTERPFQPLFGGAGVNEGDAFVAKIGNNPLPQTTTLSISAITPSRGGNAGSVTVTVHGSGFATGATVRLLRAGQPSLTAASVSVTIDAAIVYARFDLNGHQPAVYDLLVTNPTGESVSQSGAFTVETGGRPRLWLDIVGRDEFRPGRAQTYYLFFGNRGNLDAAMVPLIVAIPKSAQYELVSKLITPPQPVQGQTFDFGQIPLHFETDDEKVIPLFIPLIQAQSSNFLKIRVTGGDEPLRLVARINQVSGIFAASVSNVSSVASRSSLATPSGEPTVCPHGFGKCLETIGAEVINCASGFVNPANNCRQAMADYGESLKCSALTTAGDAIVSGEITESGLVSSGTQAAAGGVATGVACASGSFPVAAQMVAAMYCGFGENAVENACPGFGPFTAVSRLLIPLFARDPNHKFGSRGVGTKSYLFGEEPLRYSIEFENIESATAPAQDVVITDQLDASKLDFDTFSLGPIGFGKDKQVIPPAGLSEFNKDIDLRPEKNLIVRVHARLDKPTGLLTWRFFSIDPATGLPTEDPTTGFLPPNRTAPEGEGQVLFTVQPKEGIATGAEIRNCARIVFDNNPFIDTPEWLNTIDNAKPISRILPMPATQCTTGIPLQWTGTDEGSGVRDFTILVADNGGPLEPLLSNTTATSMLFQGQVGHTYSFYSLAQDNTQNFEDLHASPDATVSIVAVPPPVVTPPPPVTVRTGIAATSCGAFISDATLGAAIARSNCLGVTITRDGVRADHFFPVGSTTISYTATDAVGNSASVTQTVTVVDSTPPILTVPAPPVSSAGSSCRVPIPDLISGSTATDNCGGSIRLTQNPTAGTLVGPGPHAITVTATDVGGNSKSVTRTFTVNATPSFLLSIAPTIIRRGGKVTLKVNFGNCASNRQSVTLKVSLTTPRSRTLMLTLPVTLRAGQRGSFSLPLLIPKSTPTGLYSLTLDVYMGGTKVGTSTAQLTVSP